MHQTLDGATLGFLLTLFGAAAAYFLTLGEQPSTLQTLRYLFPGLRSVTYRRIDALILIAVGAVIGHFAFEHRSAIECLLAGLSWCGSLNTILRQGGHGGTKPEMTESSLCRR
jgi:hypothetical protein